MAEKTTGNPWFEWKWTYQGTKRVRYLYRRWRDWSTGRVVKRSEYVRAGEPGELAGGFRPATEGSGDETAT